MNGTTYRYYYAGGKLMRMTWGTNTIDFFYDANGTPYAMKYNGTVYYYITNLQGDVMRIVDGSQNTVTSYDYDPYGKVISATGTLANINPLRYRGYVYDQETGFYYLQSRYYDPTVGRFINADSYATTGQGIIGHNMFAYCEDNPVNKLDPAGHVAVPIAVAAANSWNPAGWGVLLLLIGALAVDALANGKTAGAMSKLPAISKDEREKTDAKAEAIPTTPSSSTVIYRYGGTNPGNLTPKTKDKYSGLRRDLSRVFSSRKYNFKIII